MSNVGKSFITAALCRIFHRAGYSCAPFKSQNMALNSFITPDGLEIGRAQAMQAAAAGIEPSAEMNPILLKPTDNVGSQVIVNGKPIGNMRARDYFRHKKELVPEIIKAYETLDKKYDIIIIEGAGSPVELNLKKDDIVNMGLAELVGSPVVLVGDIDRGGVFAQLIGTLSLLEKKENDLVKGLIVNGFRGDISLFSDGVSILEERGGKPVLGVVPHIECNIEDEDSLSHRLEKKSVSGDIDIAVIRLPRISNFTDLDVFEQYGGVSVRYVSASDELGKPDMIIIPGTKSTISDMKWLRESGLEISVKNLIADGTPVFGICGGYQIMGEEISDPDNTEGGGSISGMGLLKCRTVFAKEKTRKRTSGKFQAPDGFFSCVSGADFYGYEIHSGITADKGTPLTDIGGSFSGNCAGCYIHGIFDSPSVSGNIIKKLYEQKGLKYSGKYIDRNKFREEQFDIIADAVEKNLDIEKIHRIIEEGI